MMNTIEALFQQIGKMQWTDFLDIAIVAYLLYRLLPLVRNTGTKQIAKAIAVILIQIHIHLEVMISEHMKLQLLVVKL